MSEPVYTSDGVQIVEKMLNHLNSWDKKPADIRLERFEKATPTMMLQQLSGAVKVRQYVSGSYIGSWPFAVYVRIKGTDTNQMVSGTSVLNDLHKWVLENPLPFIGDGRKAVKIQMTSAPCGISSAENGEEDFQTIFELQYHQNGGT